MASKCSSASLAASPASFHPSNAATTIVWCSSGSDALTSGEVTDLAYGLSAVPGRRALSSIQAFSIDRLCLSRSRRNTFDGRLVNLDTYDIADKIRELALEH